MDQRIIDLYDDYTHRPLPRRVFLERLLALAGSLVGVQAALAALECDYARAETVAEGDPRIVSGIFEVNDGAIKGYSASPKGMAPDAANHVVIVIHENRGLNPHIRDIARRVASEGFFAMAPDFLSQMGGTPADEDKAREAFTKLKAEDAIDMVRQLVTGFKSRNRQAKIAAMGFCWGGGMVNTLATVAPELDAGIAYYGIAPALDKVAAIKASMMMHYAGLDQRVNATMPAYEAALKAAGTRYQMFTYEGVNHGFNNDTSAERYGEAAAKLAWSRSMALLKERLLA